MFRRQFLKWLGRFTFGYVVVSMGSPLRRINTTFFETARAEGCGQDTCTTRDACESGDAGHTCETRDVCREDEAGDCRTDQCMTDRSHACSGDDCVDDTSWQCQSDHCVLDSSGECDSDLCLSDSSGTSKEDKCLSDSSGGCISDYCDSDSSGSGQGDKCLSDSSGGCISDCCDSDSSGGCSHDSCGIDTSGGCMTDDCIEDSSGSCISDTCESDSSGGCHTDQCNKDSSGECTSDTCQSDSSGGCRTDHCDADMSGECVADNCVNDSSDVCQNDACTTDSSGECNGDTCTEDSSIGCVSDSCGTDTNQDCGQEVPCITDGVCFDDMCPYDGLLENVCIEDMCPTDGLFTFSRPDKSKNSRKAVAVNTALKWLYRLSLILLFLQPMLHSHVCKAAVFNVPGGDAAGLIAAVNNANANSVSDTINLGQGTYILTEGDEKGLLTITSDITINGAASGTTTIRNTGPGDGFSIFFISSEGNLTLNRLIIKGGNSAGLGGGIANEGNLSIDACTISGNNAGTAGGGIGNFDGAVAISNSAITGNSSIIGGGIATLGGSVTIVNTTFYNNTATSDWGYALGGGIASVGGTVTVKNVTISGNSAETDDIEYSAYGGGVFGVMNLINTITALNTCFDTPDLGGWPTSSGHNLIGKLTGSFWAPTTGDLSGSSGLKEYTDNGTPGNGHFPLRRSSRAIDRGDGSGAPSSDQIGTQRPQFKGTDIGAIESLLPVVKAMPWIYLLMSGGD